MSILVAVFWFYLLMQNVMYLSMSWGIWLGHGTTTLQYIG
ncbi:hypothetical protein VCSRO99_3587 [Vibrio cholerae]|nr:hypothetical protein VCSRO99_3587 [Vibrio cholerae]